MAKRKTIYDVAKEAGVSISTVSRVINGAECVSSETRLRVEKACKNYRPAPYVKRGAVKKTGTVGIVVCHEPEYFFLNHIYAHALAAISKVSKETGYKLLLDINGEEEGVLGLFRERKADGFLLMGVRRQTTLVERLAEERIPFVIIGSYHGSAANVCQIDINNREAVRSVTSYLLGLGHRRIGIITGSPQYTSCSERLAGYRQALEEAGIEVNAGYVESCENITEVKAENLAKKLLFMRERVTAIVAFNDMVAMAVYKAAKDVGVRIPDDVSVVGFDDTPMATHTQPPLTSIWQPSLEKGERAMRFLVGCLDGGELPRGAVEMNCITMYRDSCAPPGNP